MKRNRWSLSLYDAVILLALFAFQLFFGRFGEPWREAITHDLIFFVCALGARFIGGIYHLVWRYGGIQCYIRLLFVDAIGFLVYVYCDLVICHLIGIPDVSNFTAIALAGADTLLALAMRMIYRYAFKFGTEDNAKGRFLRFLLKVFAKEQIGIQQLDATRKIKIAIVGAGRLGVTLVDELMNNTASAYEPVCFVDFDRDKTGREVRGIPVILENSATAAALAKYDVVEVVFAISNISPAKRRELYTNYTNAGYKVKVYDYPMMQTAEGKRQMREMDINELLFRKPIRFHDGKAKAYYKDKVILITGGGGSIGSELCRQLAKMAPKQIIILDIYENGAYDVQQELRIAYGRALNLEIEICSITNKSALERVFERYHPQIVINAAAHKHVPLMERNCVEAVCNNVMGTRNLVEICEEFGVERFMMVSTDKAVNPTNIMGATKRMCEMIVISASKWGKVKYSCTRFGNVLGSAGSVIPLFKKQIANGGPVTLTDKRIIRYFMTIPEASQLVLESGAMANNGELFVLDMGSPVKIYDLAKTMIHLSGMEGIEIREIGLRPGEKLYEELLVKTEELDKTENNLIFIEKDTPLTRAEIYRRLNMLEHACDSGDDNMVRMALKQVVSTYHYPEEVNAKAAETQEMQEASLTNMQRVG